MTEERGAYAAGQPGVVGDVQGFLRELSGYYAIIPDELIKAGNPSAVSVYGALDRIGRDGESTAALSLLHEYCGLSIPTIRKALDWLIDQGYINLLAKGTGHDTSRYHLPFQRKPSRVQPRVKKPDTPIPRDKAGVQETLTQGSTGGERGLHHSIDTRESIEPEAKESSVITPDSLARAPKKRVTKITSDFCSELIESYKDYMTPEDVNEQVTAAISHKAYDKWHDKQRYVKNWLKRHVGDGVKGGNPNGTNQAKPNPGRTGGLSAFAKYG